MSENENEFIKSLNRLRGGKDPSQQFKEKMKRVVSTAIMTFLEDLESGTLSSTGLNIIEWADRFVENVSDHK